jgi:hypothetical protein
MNDLNSISTSHHVAQKRIKSEYKVAPKAAPDSGYATTTVGVNETGNDDYVLVVSQEIAGLKPVYRYLSKNIAEQNGWGRLYWERLSDEESKVGSMPS